MFDVCFLYLTFSRLIVDFSVTICIWVMRIQFIHSFKLFWSSSQDPLLFLCVIFY